MNTIPQDDPPLKRCTKCGEEKPATPEFYPRDKNGKNGFYSACKECKNAYARVYEKERRRLPEVQEYRKAYHNGYDEAYRKQPDVRERARINARTRYRRPEVQEYVKAYQNARYRRPGVREHELAYKSTYRKSLKGRERVKAVERNKRAQRRGAPGRHTAQDIRNLLKWQKGKCAYCKQKLITYHVDHIVPLSRDGSNNPDNLQILCPSCNMRKGNKLPHEFYEGGRLL